MRGEGVDLLARDHAQRACDRAHLDGRDGGGDYDRLMQSIREELLPLGDETIIHPGHGPSTTIGREKRTNPFL